MSKAKNNIPRAAIHVGAPAKSFSAAEGYEPERRGWDENTYCLKNQDTNNHYDLSRKHLNFEINSQGEIVPLCSNPVPLHERLQKRLDALGFKPYMDKNNPLGISDNSPNCTVGIIVSGDHRVLTRLAFGDQEVDFKKAYLRVLFFPPNVPVWRKLTDRMFIAKKRTCLYGKI